MGAEPHTRTKALRTRKMLTHKRIDAARAREKPYKLSARRRGLNACGDMSARAATQACAAARHSTLHIRSMKVAAIQTLLTGFTASVPVGGKEIL